MTGRRIRRLLMLLWMCASAADAHLLNMTRVTIETAPDADGSLVLEIDLGPLGIVVSSAQLTARHTSGDLIGRQVVVATDLGTRLIAGVKSEVLVLGAEAASGGITLLGPDTVVADGTLVQ